MKLGSLFDGSGGFPLAGAICGIEPVWASEIEPFPIRVTTKRFPNVKHLGSVTDINGAEIEPVDIITFGSPCQDLSVAGKRAGLHDGERSSLFFEAIRIIKEMRAHDRAAGRADVDCRPWYIVWENVFGAFSSNKGEDFRCVLEEICKVAGSEVSIPRPDKGKWEPAGCIVGGITQWLGAPSTPSIGECPSVAVASTLSQILQANVPEKYYLSKTACEGILRRAERRGKVLPQMLKDALEEVVALGA